MTTSRIWRVIVSIGICAVIMKAPSGKPGDLPDENSGKILPGRDNRSYGTPTVISKSQLEEAALQGDTERMRLFIAAGADINQRVTWARLGNKTVLMIAAKEGHTAMVEMLLEAGADIDAKDGIGNPYDRSWLGNTAFMYAVRGGDYDTVRLFIQKGVDVNQSNNARFTPIIYAVSGGNRDIVELLIRSGADVNIKNGDALRKACCSGNREIVKVLLEAGADVNFEYVRYRRGKREVVTAITIAKEQGHDDIVSLLKDAGALE